MKSVFSLIQKRALHTSSKLKTKMTEVLLVKKLSANAKLPVRASTHAAGYDLFAAQPATVAARGRIVVPTDVAIALPAGTYGRVAPRSGLAVKNGIDVGAGVIDEDYRGNVMVLLFNHSDTPFVINQHDRIAQLLIEKITTPPVQEVEDLDATARGSGGFGSTGTSAVLNHHTN